MWYGDWRLVVGCAVGVVMLPAVGEFLLPLLEHLGCSGRNLVFLALLLPFCVVSVNVICCCCYSLGFSPDYTRTRCWHWSWWLAAYRARGRCSSACWKPGVVNRPAPTFLVDRRELPKEYPWYIPLA